MTIIKNADTPDKGIRLTRSAQRLVAVLGLALACSACVTLPQPVVVDFAEQKALAPVSGL